MLRRVFCSTGFANAQDRADREALFGLLTNVHKTFYQIAEKSGQPELMQAVQQMNGAYKDGLANLNNPDVKALLSGTNENAIINTLTGGKSIKDIKAIRNTIGDKAFSSLADDAIGKIAARCKESGHR